MLEELQQRNYAKTTVHDDIVSVERRAVPTPVRMNAARSATAPMVTQPLPAHWAEVMQETPRFTAASSPPVSSEG
jgi:hypothetical protein